MTREEAITVFKAFMDNPLFSDVHKAAFNIAIHDIKQRHDWDINNLILINKDNYESQEPKEGHWIKGYTFPDGAYWKCDKCNELIKVKIPMRYCNNCGAKMVEPQEGEGCTK